MNEVTSASRVVTHTSIYWDYTPDDELYLKYKDVFDNPRYYNQETGAINWTEKMNLLIYQWMKCYNQEQTKDHIVYLRLLNQLM